MEQKFLYIEENLSRNFKFKIDENNNFIWENYSIKYVLSNPSVQPWDEYVKIESIKDFMYFYYNVKIFKRVYDFYDDERDMSIYRWDLVAQRNTHDFPCLLDLDYILDELLKVDLKKDGVKEEFKDFNIYSKRYYTEGFGCDDFYDFTKILKEFKGESDKEHYIGYLGCTFDSDGNEESCGIRTPYLNTEDILELSKCIKSFLNYTIEEFNKSNDEYINLHSKNKFEVDGKLYIYNIGFKNKKHIINDFYDSIFVKGDNVEITYLDKNEVGNICSKDKDIIIKEINKDKLISEDGRIFEFKNIIHIFENMSDEKLKYNILEVEKDFYSILTDFDKNFFRKSTEDEIFDKYKEAICDRTWMCRGEHNFPVFNSTENNIENVNIIIKIIINNIKQKLK